MHEKVKIFLLLYFTTTHAPEGIDQVEAAESCFAFAIQYESELINHPKAKEIVPKIKRKYPIFKIQHFLHSHGLAEEKFLHLVENPKELITALYYHESIITDQKININELVYEICCLHELDYNVIQMNLLKKWLKFHGDSQCHLDSVVLMEETATAVALDEGVSDEDVKRAYFILKGWTPEKAIHFLALHILDNDTQQSTGKRLQLIECCTKLLPKEKVNRSDELIKLELESYILIKCVHQLRQLGYKTNIEKFKTVDKLSLLKQIWKNHASDERALQLIIFICLEFNINEPQIWNGVLKQIVRLNMEDILLPLVHIVSMKAELLSIDALGAAWNSAIKTALRQVFREDTQAMEISCTVRPLILLQSCPVSAKLNYVELTEMCIRHNLPYLATVFIFFAPACDRIRVVELLKPHFSKGFVESVHALQEYGVLSSIIQSSLKELQ